MRIQKETILPRISFEVQLDGLLTVDYRLSLVNSPQSTVHGRLQESSKLVFILKNDLPKYR